MSWIGDFESIYNSEEYLKKASAVITTRDFEGDEDLRILVIGASGMLGHKLYQAALEDGHETFGTIRQPIESFARFSLFRKDQVYDRFDVRQDSDIQRVFDHATPDVVVNCAGVVKSLAKDEIETISINSLSPHRLARVCSLQGARLFQISTDCVFSGRSGGYSEENAPDPVDLYGRSKLLGEVTYENHLTIRTSIIGRELGTKRNLIEWFLSQIGQVEGYANSFFSGLTTRALSRIILRLADEKVNGLIHVAGERISKYDLLNLVKRFYGLDSIVLVRSTREKIDRSLLAPKMLSLGIEVPPMEEMIREMVSEDDS